MQIIDFILLAILAVLLVLAVRYSVKHRNQCCGDCSRCAQCHACSQKQIDVQKANKK